MIGAYAPAGKFSHAETRPRKLLLHRREIDRLWGRVGEGDFEKVLELFAQDAVFEFPFFPLVGIGAPMEGKDAIRKQIAPVLEGIDGFKFKVD